MTRRRRPATSSPAAAPPTGPRDFVRVAVDYAREAVADRKGRKHGKWIRLAARRFLDDLKRAKAKDAPFRFDPWWANDVCLFAEQLPHVEGVWDTPLIVLHESHVFFLVQLFGFRWPDGRRRFTTALFAVARKNAKALALDTPIPTPGGWSTMGELQPGDMVFGADGKPCAVTAVSPVYHDHECYRLRFSNGESVVADAGHLWLTSAQVDQPGKNRVGNGQRRTRVRTTKEIAESLRFGARGDLNHSVAMPEALDTGDIELPVAPYTLGAWLGDGHSNFGRITCSREDSEILASIQADGWPVREIARSNGKAATFSISDGDRSQIARDKSFAALLRRNGLIGNKHIPAAYLRASKAQRLALLQGLMDTDGTVAKNGRVISYCGTNEALISGVAELLSSMGIKYSWRRDPLVCNGRPVPGVGHKLQFMAFRDELPVFRLRRKLNRMRDRASCRISPRSRTVQIIEADRIASVPVRCITVDSADSLFLFGRTMLPTHNSTLAAIILLYCLCCEGEVGPQAITAATTGQQARIVFNVAKRMVEKTPDLREAFNLQPFANAIAAYANGGTAKPINAKASTQDGLNPSMVSLDEVHAHKTHDLLNVLKSAAGARKNPLFLYTTTEGYESPGPWPEQRRFAEHLLEGVLTADHYLALIYAVDEQQGNPGEPGYRPADGDFDARTWIKANPLITVNPILAQEIAKEAVEAKAMPGRHAEFKIKRLNRRSSSASSWIVLEKWQRCTGTVDLEVLRKTPCVGALDLASSADMTALALVWRIDGRWVVLVRYWVPSDAVRQRTERGTVSYAGWVASGHVTQTDGDVTDYAVIEDEIKALRAEFQIQTIAYDPWNASDLVNRLVTDGVPMVQFIQGTKSYHPAMQEFERAYTSGNFAHGDNPVLTWNAANLVTRRDVNMNMAPDRKRSADKIDGMCAVLMGIGTTLANQPTPPKVINQGFVTI